MAKEVEFQKMNKSEYEAWRKFLVEDYAEDLVRHELSGIEASREIANEELNELTKGGFDAENSYFLNILDKKSKTKIGTMFYLYSGNQCNKGCFIGDFMIFEDYRGQGYGRAAMILCETSAKADGMGNISLTVFGKNTPAVSLYSKLGYQPLIIRMQKKLD
jgi:RimJ/RimL family protein N-acetyltransferase